MIISPAAGSQVRRKRGVHPVRLNCSVSSGWSVQSARSHCSILPGILSITHYPIASKVKTVLHILFDRLVPQPRTTEKSAQVLGSPESPAVEENGAPRPGYGRNGAAACTSAQQVEIPRGDMKAGCSCPECQKGTVYLQKERKTFVRFTAWSPSPLTLFLRKAGAPLENNLCEQALKKAVLHWKNALFYRTMNGATEQGESLRLHD